MTTIYVVQVNGPGAHRYLIHDSPSRSEANPPGDVEREAGDPLPLHGVPGHLEETDTATGREQ